MEDGVRMGGGVRGKGGEREGGEGEVRGKGGEGEGGKGEEDEGKGR